MKLGLWSKTRLDFDNVIVRYLSRNSKPKSLAMLQPLLPKMPLYERSEDKLACDNDFPTCKGANIISKR
jgi:hypothetical protein